jgi:hypothetical protein
MINPTNPPTAKLVWCTNEKDLGSPMVTEDGSGKAIVWVASSGLYGYDGDDGTEIFDAPGILANPIDHFNTFIDTGDGRMAIAVAGHLYVFGF